MDPVGCDFFLFHGVTCEDEWLVAHMRLGNGFSGQVRDPVTELVVTFRD